MKKNDIYLAAGVLAAAFLIWLAQKSVWASPGAQITVTQDGEIVGVYCLAEENELVFTDGNRGRNVLVIQGGEAYMQEADCLDRLCIKQKAVSKRGESIICLPHKLSVEVTAGEDAEVDSVAR